MTSSLVDFVFQATDIAFYGSVASFGQPLYVLFGATQQVLFKLCSLDVAVRASEAWTQAAQFLATLLKQGYKRTGKPLPLAFFQI